MTRRDLLDLLTVERHAPGPRPPKFTRCDPPRPLTAEEQAHNRAVLMDATSGDATVIEFRERQAS